MFLFWARHLEGGGEVYSGAAAKGSAIGPNDALHLSVEADDPTAAEGGGAGQGAKSETEGQLVGLAQNGPSFRGA